MKLKIALLMTILLTNCLLATTIYENGDDASDWTISDNRPSGATISSVADNGGNVIAFNGHGRKNAYLLGDKRASNKSWNNSDDKNITWSMKFNESFRISVYVKTTKGSRVLYYDNKSSKGKRRRKIHYGLGSQSTNGEWQTITRDLEADIQEFESNNELEMVYGFEVRGSGRVDDIKMTEENSPIHYGTLTGIVRDTDSNDVLSNVNLTIGNSSVQTNAQGYFTFTNLIPNDQTVIKVSKNGFINTSEIITINEGMNSDINIYIRESSTPLSFDSTTDIDISQNGATVHIPANGLADENGEPFTGTASVSLTLFDPTTEEGRRAFPGDFIGIRPDGTSGPLISYGFIDVVITDTNGNRLNLAQGVNANIIIPIPVSLQATAPTTTTLWWFNPDDAQWHDEGTLTRNGNVYEGTVPHFSKWNADYLYQRSFVKGRLIHCETNEPVSCGEIIVQGNGWESRERCTNNDGTFDQLPVLFNTNANIYGIKNGARSNLHPFTTTSIGQTYNVGDICINNPVAKIILTWESQPQDLDAHLTFDNGNGNREMIYYAHTNANDGSAGLDTDDVDGWGPEIITISSWHDGIYRYAVHHYSGDRTISTSGALLNMIIDSNGNGNTNILSLTPPVGAQGSKDVWSAWDIEIQNGTVQSITPINEYLNNISSGDIGAFSPVP